MKKVLCCSNVLFQRFQEKRLKITFLLFLKGHWKFDGRHLIFLGGAGGANPRDKPPQSGKKGKKEKEKERLERERVEKEKMEKEKAERERIEKEKAEKEKQKIEEVW